MASTLSPFAEAPRALSWDGPPPITHQGTVVEHRTINQIDFDTGETKVYPDGNPKRQVVVTLDTDAGERVSLYVRIPSALLRAIKDAVKVQGRDDLYPGDYLIATYTGDGARTGRKNAPKLFAASLTPQVAETTTTGDDDDDDDF
jgi:hypothetical protein